MTQQPYGYAPQQGFAPPQYGPPQQQYPPQGPPQGFAPQAPQQVGATVDSATFLNGGGSGAPSFDFANIGDTVAGVITHKQVRQKTEVGTTTLKWNADGSPQMQLELTLQTDLRNWQSVKKVPSDPRDPSGQTPQPPSADTGLRRIYVWFHMRDAVARAVQAAGATDINIGDWIGVRYTQALPNPKGRDPIKDYDAQFRPAPSQAGQFVAQAPAPQAPPAQYAPAPPQQPQYAPAPPQQYAPAPPQPGPAAALNQALAPQAPPQYAPQPQGPQGGWAPPANQALEPPF